jgi:hypothetical protein
MNESREIITLREYLEKVIALEFRAHGEKHNLEQEAIKQAREQMELRLGKLNELRSEVIQDRGEYLRRDVFESQFDPLMKRLQLLESFKASAMGAAAVLCLVSGAIGAAILKLFGG